jgi:hypothetical protein
MMDEEDVVNNQCADLVAERRFEPALRHLFTSKPVGEWVRVAELYRLAGQDAAAVKPTVVAAWLPAPDDAENAVVVFHDPDTLWSMTAWYNVERLMGCHR